MARITAKDVYSVISERLANDLQLERTPMPQGSRSLTTALGKLSVFEFATVRIRKGMKTSGIPDIELVVAIKSTIVGKEEVDDGTQYTLHLGGKALKKAVYALLEEEEAGEE